MICLADHRKEGSKESERSCEWHTSPEGKGRKLKFRFLQLLLRRVQQQAEGRGGVLDAGLGLGGGQGVEEAVIVGPAVDLPSPRLR